MRTVNAAGLALLARMDAGERVPMPQLLELRFDPPLYLSSSTQIPWDGKTWTPAGLGPIEAVEDSADEMPPLRFTMPGLNEAQVALALEPGTEGVGVVVYDALVDPDTGEVAEAVRAWVGTLNVPELVNGKQSDLTVTAEHRGMLALRPKPTRYTNDEQQRRYPGDTCLDFDPATDAAPLVWPAASFFKA